MGRLPGRGVLGSAHDAGQPGRQVAGPLVEAIALGGEDGLELQPVQVDPAQAVAGGPSRRIATTTARCRTAAPGTGRRGRVRPRAAPRRSGHPGPARRTVRPAAGPAPRDARRRRSPSPAISTRPEQDGARGGGRSAAPDRPDQADRSRPARPPGSPPATVPRPPGGAPASRPAHPRCGNSPPTAPAARLPRPGRAHSRVAGP